MTWSWWKNPSLLLVHGWTSSDPRLRYGCMNMMNTYLAVFEISKLAGFQTWTRPVYSDLANYYVCTQSYDNDMQPYPQKLSSLVQKTKQEKKKKYWQLTKKMIALPESFNAVLSNNLFANLSWAATQHHFFHAQACLQLVFWWRLMTFVLLVF